MNVLFVSRVKYGTMGSGALNWFPGYVAQNGHAVKIVECVGVDTNTESEGDVPFTVDVHNVRSDSLFDHLDVLFRVAEAFPPDVLYIFGRSDLYDFVYHLRHRYPRARILIDIRSPLLTTKAEEMRSIESKFSMLQYYADHINTCDMDSLMSYTKNIFKPVSVLPVGVNCAGVKVKLEKELPKAIRRFVFVGSIFRRRYIDRLIENFIGFAEDVGGGVSLDIFGGGDAVKQIAQLIDSKSAGQLVRLRGAVSQSMLFNVLCDYDAGVAYVPHELYSVAPSLKSLEYSAAGLPVLASDTLGHKRYCHEHGFRFGLFPNERSGFVKVFRSAYSNGIDREDVITNLKVVRKFDWRRIVEDRLIPALEA